MKNTVDPIKILQSLLERVQARRQQELNPEAEEAQSQANAAGGELLPDYKGKDVYISFDGDNIGNAVARAESRDDEEELANISNKINQGQDLFVDFLVHHQGKLIEAGGDEGVGRCSSNCLVDIEEFRQRYFEMVGATVTVGIGEKISEATKARMLGKLRGKNQVCFYDDSTESELQMRTQEGGQEAQKLGQAGLLPQEQGNDQEQPEVPKFGIDSSDAESQSDWQNEYEEPSENNEEESEEDQESPRKPFQLHEESDEDMPEEEKEEEEPRQEDIDQDEYYDYTDLPFDQKDDTDFRKKADKITKEEGGDPRFLRFAAKRLLGR